MDTLTHTLLGAAIGETILGKRIGRKAMFYGALTSNIPDIDVVGILFLSDSQQLLFHRGITHSFFFLLLISMLLGWLSKFWIKDTRVNWKHWTVLFFLTMLSHLLLDSLTCYGLGILEPFDNYRLSFNTIFVIDPFYTLPLLISVVLLLSKKTTTAERSKWNTIGLCISSCYLFFTFLIQNYVLHIMEQSFKEQKLASNEFIVTPTPLNTFLWMGYSNDKEGTWIGYYSIFDKEKKIDYFRVKKMIPYYVLLKKMKL